MDLMDEHLVVTLLRHGLTKQNEKHQYLGWTDASLSEKGIQQVGSYQLLSKADLYISSDLKRCVETAEILFPDKEILSYSLFREMNFGDWEERTYEELKNNDVYQNWLQQPFTICPPNGECFHQFTARVDEGWRQLLLQLFQKRKTKAILITHGGVIRYLLSRFSPKETNFWDWRVPHETAFELCWTKQKGRGESRCTLLREVILTEKQNG